MGIILPFDSLSGMIETHITVDIQPFIAEPAVTMFNISVVNPVEKQQHITTRSQRIKSLADEFRGVIHRDHVRLYSYASLSRLSD
jgi:hypothetical protein